MKKFTICTVAGISLCLVMISCASSSNAWKPIDDAVEQNNFSGGIDAMVKGQDSKKPIYMESNVVSLYLDKGLIEHYAGQYAASAESLQEADRLIKEAETKSVTQAAASFILNDNTMEYAGEDYENIYLNIFNALNFYHQDKLDDAMVEIRILTESNGKLGTLSSKYSKDAGKLDEALDPVKKVMSSIPSLSFSSPVNFSDSALARYLSALFYRGRGDVDDARIEFDKIAEAYQSSTTVYKNHLPASIADERNVPDGKARLNVIGFSGLSPIKEAAVVPILATEGNQIAQAIAGEKRDKNTLYLMPAQAEALSAAQMVTGPLFQILHQIYNPTVPEPLAKVYNMMLTPQLKVPVLVDRFSFVDRISVQIEDGPSFDLEMIENMGAVMEQTFNAKFGSTLLKTSVRTMVKYTAAFVGAKAVADEKGDIAGVGTLSAAQKAAEATEGADIRCARYFPEKAYIGGVNLDPGTYNITVSYYSGGSLVSSEKKQNVAVKAGSLNLIEGICLK